MKRSAGAKHSEWRLGSGSGEVVEMALRMLRLELHQIADLPRMKANIRARRDASSGASDGLCRSKEPAPDSVCAWLMSGPGMFMGMRCYQLNTGPAAYRGPPPPTLSDESHVYLATSQRDTMAPDC